jgi:uncharacterized protein YpmB
MFKKIILCSVALMSVGFYSSLFAKTETTEKASPLTLVLQKVQAKGYPTISTIEYRKGVYEIMASDAKLQRVNIIFDPKKNEIVKVQPVKPLLTVMDVADRVEKKGYHTIYTVKLDQGKYKVDALDDDDNEIFLDVDAQTGMISLKVPL